MKSRVYLPEFVFLIIFTVLLLMSCALDDNDHKDTAFIPVGEWSDEYGSGYNITNTNVHYYTAASSYDGVDYPAVNLKGSIEAAIDFSHNAGVLLIKITEEEHSGLTVGKYTCVYYREYSASHVLLANPVDASYKPIETDTIDAAKSTFTVDAVDTHISFWGTGYTK